MEFKDRLLLLIKNKQLWNAEIARQTKISKSRLSGFTSGKYNPSVNNLINLADYFNCSLDFIAGISQNMNYGKYNKANIENFAANYLKALKNRKISNRLFSKKIGLNKSTSCLWKKGTLPHLNTLIKIVYNLQITLDEIFERSINK